MDVPHLKEGIRVLMNSIDLVDTLEVQSDTGANIQRVGPPAPRLRQVPSVSLSSVFLLTPDRG